VSINLKKPKDVNKIIIMKQKLAFILCCYVYFCLVVILWLFRIPLFILTFHVNTKLRSNHISNYVGKKFGMKLYVCTYFSKAMLKCKENIFAFVNKFAKS